MVAALSLVSTAAAAPPGTAHVCAADSAAPAACDFYDLEVALADQGYDTYVLEPGEHAAAALITRTLTLRAQPGATLTWANDGDTILDVRGGAGSRFEDLVIQGTKAHPGRAAVYVSGAAVVFDGLTVRSIDADPDPLLWFGAGAVVTLEDLLLEDSSFQLYPVFLQSGADVTLRRATFRDLTGPFYSAIYTLGSDLRIEDSTFEAGAGPSSFVWGASADIVTERTSFYPGGAGSPIALLFGSLTMTSGEIGASSEILHAIASTDAPVTLADLAIDVAGGTGAVYCTRCPALSLDGVTVAGVSPSPTPLPYPLVKASDTPSVVVSDSWFCDAPDGGALDVWGALTGSDVVVDGSVFQGNAHDDGAGAITLTNAGLVLTRSTFLANAADLAASGAALQADVLSTLDVQDTLFVSNNAGVATVSALFPSVNAFTNNAFDLATATPTTFPLPAGNPSVSVVFAPADAYTRCGVSVAIDAELSDPLVVDGGIGAGPLCYDVEIPQDGIDQDCDGLELCARDDDADSYTGPYTGTPLAEAALACLPPGPDCDDADPAIHPGAAETWYDGVDGDCAGDDDFDADLDGHPIPDDCDDADPAIHPGAVDLPYDGVDVDCAQDDDFDADGDGVTAAEDCNDDDVTLGRCRLIGSGCATGPQGVATALALLATLASARRRRPSKSVSAATR